MTGVRPGQSLTDVVDEPGDGFHSYREAQRQQEHAVDQSAENFGSLPTVRILGRSFSLCQFDSLHGDNQTADIIELQTTWD